MLAGAIVFYMSLFAYALLLPLPFVPIDSFLEFFIKLCALLFVSFLFALIVRFCVMWPFRNRLLSYRSFNYLLPVYNSTDRPYISSELHDLIIHNRSAELSVLENSFRKGNKCVIILGFPGIGKSTIASALISKSDFWINLRNKPVDLKCLLIIILQYLGANDYVNIINKSNPVGIREIRCVCDLLSNSERKLVFDNFESVLDKKGIILDPNIFLFIRTLIESDTNSQIIITSQVLPYAKKDNPFSNINNTLILKIKGLTHDHGVSLLKRIISTPVSDELLVKLSIISNGNPLIIKLASSVINDHPGSVDKRTIELFINKFKKLTSLRNFIKIASKGLYTCIDRLCLIHDHISYNALLLLFKDLKKSDDLVRNMQSKSLLEIQTVNDSSFYCLNTAVAQLNFDKLARKKYRFKKAAKRAANLYLSFAESQKGTQPINLHGIADAYLKAHYYLMISNDQLLAFKLATHILFPLLSQTNSTIILYNIYKEKHAIFKHKLLKSNKTKNRHLNIIVDLSSIAGQIGLFAEALDYSVEALNLSKSLKCEKGMMKAYGNIGCSLQNLGEDLKAIENLKLQRNLADKLNSKRDRANSEGNLAISYKNIKQYDNARGYYIKQLIYEFKCYKERKDYDISALANAYNNLGALYIEHYGKIEKAKRLFEMQNKISTEFGYGIGIAKSKINLGNIYKELGNNAKARVLCQQGLKRFSELGIIEGIAHANRAIAITFLAENNWEMCLYYNARSYLISIKQYYPETGSDAERIWYCMQKMNRQRFRGVIVKSVGLGESQKIIETFEKVEHKIIEDGADPKKVRLGAKLEVQFKNNI